MIEAPSPAEEKQNPFLPPGPAPLIMEEFGGVNTSTTRPGVDDRQCFWIDGFMPLGPRQLRTLYGIGDALFSTTADNPVVFYEFANIGATPLCIIFMADGSVRQINTQTGVGFAFLPAGTILSPSRNSAGITQYGNQYIVIVADQTDGYWIWDGHLLFTAGTLGPQVTVTAGGAGYVDPVAIAAGGAGAGSDFVVTSIAGVVTSIEMVSPGSGYLVGDVVTLNILDAAGPGAGATATVTLMPFGVQGTAVETYAGRVWVIAGPLVEFTAPGSVFDFSTQAGGGNFISTDSFLRVRYVNLKQSNGFLYLIGDSSVNYISGVTITGTPPVTSFTNQNADPEVGSPWPGTVLVFGRNIIFANAFGVHVSYGAAVTKISDALDGVYNSVTNFAGAVPSAAKAIIFGKKVWMLLLPIIDPVTGQYVNKLLMWNGKQWWAAEQDVDLTYIQCQEIDSVITAFGTDGTSIYPLFRQPSATTTKTVQSRLWDKPGGYQLTKVANRFWALFQYYGFDGLPISVSLDNERGGAFHNVGVSFPSMTWVNDTGGVIQWFNDLGNPMVWINLGTGIAVTEPTAVLSQNGVLIGMTITTQESDMALISAMVEANTFQYRG